MTYPSRIVCLTEETTETLYLLGEGHRVVGGQDLRMSVPAHRFMRGHIEGVSDLVSHRD